MRQYSDLAFPFSVEEVVSMGRAPHGKRDEHQAIQQVMAQTDCTALAQRDYRQLSGGEQQRVQLARVLAQLWQPQPSPAAISRRADLGAGSVPPAAQPAPAALADAPTAAGRLLCAARPQRPRCTPIGSCCCIRGVWWRAARRRRCCRRRSSPAGIRPISAWCIIPKCRCRRSTCVNNVKGAIKRPFSSQLEQEISRCLPQSGGSTARSSYSGASSNGRSRT